MHNQQSNKKKLRGFLKELIQHSYEYRTVNGLNNNVDKPALALTGQIFARASPADYDDNLNFPAGTSRPSSRVISNQIFSQQTSTSNATSQQNQGENLETSLRTNMFWLYGQFIDHTFALTNTGDEIFPISVPTGDKHFDPESTGNKTIPLSRTLFHEQTGKNGIPREQINLLSPLLDASSVYGHTTERSTYLREFKNGRLRTSQGQMLPFYEGVLVNAGNSKYGSFIAGDIRCNEHIGLISIHNLFVREHNFWAGEIQRFSPCLTDEDIYQKARIIIEAEIQAITYNEFLPALLGKDSLKIYSGYQPEVNPQLTNEFSVAAYRFGHTMVSSTMFGDRYQLRDTFFSSHKFCNDGGMSSILEQFCTTPAELLGAKMIDDLRNFLFGKPGQGGHDLVALNIQRGRDHGLSSYNKVRTSIGLPPLPNLEVLSNGDLDLKNKLTQLYGSPNNIDLFVGGLLETPSSGSLVGETFHRLIEDQFSKLRSGDRFWYQCRLSKKQVGFINKITLSQIIRRHTAIYVPDKIFYLNKEGIRKNRGLVDNNDTNWSFQEVETHHLISKQQVPASLSNVFSNPNHATTLEEKVTGLENEVKALKEDIILIKSIVHAISGERMFSGQRSGRPSGPSTKKQPVIFA